MKVNAKTKFSILGLTALLGLGAASAIIASAHLHAVAPAQPVSAAVSPEELVDTYDIVTLSDFARQPSYTGKQDLTGYYDNTYLKSSTNTDGSVVVRFKQTITYTKSTKYFNIGVRGSDYWSKGIKFYHCDDDPNQYKPWQIQCIDSGAEIASNWGGASKFQDGVTYNIELGAINYKDYATSKKIYCYVKVDGEIFVEGTFVNEADYDYSNAYVGIFQRIPDCTIEDADTRRLEAKNASSLSVGDGMIYVTVDEMPAYNGLVGHVNQYGHYAPLDANSVLKYHHADTNSDQNLSALGLFAPKTVAVNLSYNGLSATFVENDTLSFKGSFAQPTGDRRLVFNADEVNIRYINRWYFEDKYVEATNFLTSMHMDEDAVGQCNTYYPTAKSAYNGLSSDAKEIFRNGSDFVDAYLRLQQWAAAKGETVGESEITTNAAKFLLPALNEPASISAIVIIAVASTAMVTSLLFVINRRKKGHR